MRLRSILREEELKKRGKLPPTRFEIISSSERHQLPTGLRSYVIPSLGLETARLARFEAAKSMGNHGSLARQVYSELGHGVGRWLTCILLLVRAILLNGCDKGNEVAVLLTLCRQYLKSSRILFAYVCECFHSNLCCLRHRPNRVWGNDTSFLLLPSRVLSALKMSSLPVLASTT